MSERTVCRVVDVPWINDAGQRVVMRLYQQRNATVCVAFIVDEEPGVSYSIPAAAIEDVRAAMHLLSVPAEREDD